MYRSGNVLLRISLNAYNYTFYNYDALRQRNITFLTNKQFSRLRGESHAMDKADSTWEHTTVP